MSTPAQTGPAQTGPAKTGPAKTGPAKTGSAKGRRAAAALPAVALSVLALAACDKPTPHATVTVNTDSVTSEAKCYDDGHVIPRDKLASCLDKAAGKSIDVGSGDKVRIGVDPEVADTGWVMFVNGQPAIQDPSHRTYISFQGEAFFASQSGSTGETKQLDKVKVSIVEINKAASYKGVWSFDLEREK